MSHRSVVLIGMMGAGKSAVGEGLADQLGYDFIDTDDLIVKEAGKSIAKIFAEDGEPAFRAIEEKVIDRLRGTRSKVIAVGGGAPLSLANRQAFGTIGTSVYLKASAQELYQRIKNDRGRPLMQVENPRSQMAKLLREREDIYEKADITIDTEVLSVDEVVEKLIDELAKRTFETQSDL